MSDETMPEVRATSVEPEAHQGSAPTGEVTTPPGSPSEGGDAPRKRRRRGSRGGRNRRRPNGSTAVKDADADVDDVDDDDEEDDTDTANEGRVPERAEDHRDPRADRGLTADDLGADAKEQAGLARPPAGAPPVAPPSEASTTAAVPSRTPYQALPGAAGRRTDLSTSAPRPAGWPGRAGRPEASAPDRPPAEVSAPDAPAAEMSAPAAPAAEVAPARARAPRGGGRGPASGAETSSEDDAAPRRRTRPAAGAAAADDTAAAPSGGRRPRAASPTATDEGAPASGRRPRSAAPATPEEDSNGADPAPARGRRPRSAPTADDAPAAPTRGRARSDDDTVTDGRRSRPAASDEAPAPSGRRGRSAPAEAAPAETPATGRRRRGRGGAAAPEPAPRGRATTDARSGGGRGRGAQDAANKAKQASADALLDDLDEAVLEKRRGRTRKGRPTGRYFMAVSVRGGVIQVAVLEGRSLVEHYVSRPALDQSTAIDGNIYLGKVQNVLPGMEAAFVDIGTPKNGVLYRDDVTFDESDFDSKRPKIERMLRNGQPVLVQVTKNPIGTKGARLTQEVSLAGRFVVMIPNQPGTYGISKRLSDDERKRLRKILDEIRPPDAGLIVRTAADGASADELTRDMKRLQHQWEEISKKAAKSRPAVLLHQEPDLAIRVIREEFNKEYRGITIDDPELFEEVRAYVEAITPELADRVELYEDELPIFERYHIHEQLHKALERKVWLPSGGSIIIERTEALTVIDVNTAKNVGRASLEETVFANNLEAAEEIARQLRLRDIGGIIVIDFIDMEIRKNREEVVRKFKEALARDKTRTQVFEISELGLVEMTRKRISEGLVETFSTICTQCEGRGLILDHSLL